MESEDLLVARYQLAFLKGDAVKMAQLASAAMGKPGTEDMLVAAQGDTEGWYGKLSNAHELTRRAMDSALRSDAKEAVASYQAAALREVAFGNFNEARHAVEAGLKLYPDSYGVRVQAALTYAMAGDAQRARAMADEVRRNYPSDTQMRSLWLPAINAQLSLNRKKPAEAIEQLQPALPRIEYGAIPFINQVSCLYPTYIRRQGVSGSRTGQGSRCRIPEAP